MNEPGKKSLGSYFPHKKYTFLQIVVVVEPVSLEIWAVIACLMYFQKHSVQQLHEFIDVLPLQDVKKISTVKHMHIYVQHCATTVSSM